MGGIVAAEIRVVAILLVVSLVAVVARRRRFPYTVALVLAGLGFSAQAQLGVSLVETVTVSPEVILALFLPPLLFEAALHLRLVDLRRDLALILGLAVPGLFASAVLVAGILHGTGMLAWAPALVFGAMISATDPVAVVATFRALGAPRRLTTLVESESLFNDGAAIVAFGLMVAFVDAGRFSPLEAGASLARVSFGGVGVGLALGFVASQAIGRIDDHLVETTLTTILCYGSYLVAESLHVSGVLAVVMAGLVQGERGTGGMSPTTRIVLFSFWEYVAFLANSVLFLLIGLSVQLDALGRYITPVLVGVVAVVVARSVVVYGIGLLLAALRRGVPVKYLHLMVWGGLRGAVGLALALSLPATLAERPQLLAMTFGVVLFTLLGQATTVSGVMKALGLTAHDPARTAYDRLHAQLLATRSVRRYLRRQRAEGA
ncbi:MAG: cation:proton antiporter, partial [Anaerolineae bacterium]